MKKPMRRVSKGKPLRKKFSCRGGSQTKKSVLPPTSFSEESLQSDERELYPIFNNRTKRTDYFDKKTGELVTSETLKGVPFTPFNEDQFNLITELLSRGSSLKNALTKVGVSSSSFIMWRKERPELEPLIEKTKRMRSEIIQEQIYEKDIQKINKLDIMEMDSAEVQEADKKLRAIKKKQEIISSFTQKQTREQNPNERISIGHLKLVEIKIPDDLIQKLDSKFRPVDKGRGVYSLPPPTEKEREIEELIADMDKSSNVQ